MRWPRRRRPWAIRVVAPFDPSVVGQPLPPRWRTEREAQRAAERAGGRVFGEPRYQAVRVD